jgi:hypothetical protein
MKHSEQSHAGPPLLLLASVYVALFAASIAIPAVIRHGASYVNPYDTTEHIQRFFAESPLAVRVGGFFIFGSAVPLGLFSATIVSRLRFLGVRAAGTYIALFGGFMAPAALVVCGLLIWVLSIPEVAGSVSAVRAIHFLSFLTGGVAFAVGFGLLAAGVSVTSLFTKLLSRGTAIFGLIIAAAGEFSTLSLLTNSPSALVPLGGAVAWFPNPAFLLPVTRFGGFIWLFTVALTLPKKRNEEVQRDDQQD